MGEEEQQQSGVDMLGGLVGIAGDLFGSTGSTSGSGTSSEKSNIRRSEQLKLDQDAVNKIIQDVLGGAGGLAEIFAGEQNAGIFNSSVSAQAAGDLTSRIVGELAKITGETVTTEEGTREVETTSTQDTADEGILGGIKNLFS